MMRQPPWSQDLDWPSHLPPFDPFDPAIQADPYPHYKWMLEHAPVLRAGPAAQHFVFVSRHREVTAGLRDAAAFSSIMRTDVAVPGFLLNMDPPEHAEMRRLVSRAFSPRALAAVEPRIAARVFDAWQRFLERGGGDAIGEFASPCTIGVICDVLGIPNERAAEMRRWTSESIDYLAHVLRGVPGGASRDGYDALLDTISAAMNRAAAGDEESVIGNLARLRDEGVLSRSEAAGFAGLLFTAGHETTTLMTGNCLDILAREPGWLTLLREPDGPSAFLEEAFRFRPPVHRLARVATRDVALGGVLIPAGSNLRFMVGAANRDPRQFDHPDRFAPGRAHAGSAAFGYGVHLCIGAWLARLELRLILASIGAMAAQLSIDPDQAPVPLAGGAFATVGLRALPLRATSAGRT